MNILRLFHRVYTHVRPRLRHEHAGWTRRAGAIPDPELRRQAQGSLASKRFHLEGGLVFVAQRPERADALVPLIVAYQTLCDYLDNLCDRSTSRDPVDFALLHTSLEDALSPGAAPRRYYEHHAEQEDGGYVAALVAACQQNCLRLPGFALVQPRALELAALYSALQVHKHVVVPEREPRLLGWWEAHRPRHPELRWQEFAAATGSTIGLFELLCQAASPSPDPAALRAVDAAYFPWISGLHILLDYLVDLEEDEAGGDLNFVRYYGSANEALERMSFILARARDAARGLVAGAFHETIVDGLVAFYLADHKVEQSRGWSRSLAGALRAQTSPVTGLLASAHRRLTGR